MITQYLSLGVSILASLAGITFIIVFHEFGHYLFCKLFGVYTPTFSIGIGKKLFAKKIGETDFCISASPLGGYVEIATESTPEHKGFNSLYYIQKVLVVLGGIACNLLLAYLLFIGLFFSGMPDSAFMPYENNTPMVQTVPSDSINSSLQDKDLIISINTTPVHNDALTIKQTINNLISKQIMHTSAIVSRNGQEITVQLNFKENKEALPLEQRLDLQLVKKAPLSFTQCISEGIQLTNFYIRTIAQSISKIFTAKESKSLAGPIMTLAASTKGAQKGFKYLLIFLAIISINLGIMNFLPLPIFDGGQFVIFTIETILQRQMSEKVRNIIGTFSWTLVIGLFIIFGIKDLYTLLF